MQPFERSKNALQTNTKDPTNSSDQHPIHEPSKAIEPGINKVKSTLGRGRGRSRPSAEIYTPGAMRKARGIGCKQLVETPNNHVLVEGSCDKFMTDGVEVDEELKRSSSYNDSLPEMTNNQSEMETKSSDCDIMTFNSLKLDLDVVVTSTNTTMNCECTPSETAPEFDNGITVSCDDLERIPDSDSRELTLKLNPIPSDFAIAPNVIQGTIEQKGELGTCCDQSVTTALCGESITSKAKKKKEMKKKGKISKGKALAQQECLPRESVPFSDVENSKSTLSPAKNDDLKNYPIKSLSVKTEETDSWDSIFDDAGECLDECQKKELEKAVGKVKILKPEIDYFEFSPKDPNLDDESFGHLLEIYDFPSTFKTVDLMNIFKSTITRDFDIRWVDDTHAVGIFASNTAASDALMIQHPMLKMRQISAASRATKLKIQKLSDELICSTKERPKTTAMAARRLVTASLGLAASVPKEQISKERKMLKEAKDKKRNDAKVKEKVWDGAVD